MSLPKMTFYCPVDSPEQHVDWDRMFKQLKMEERKAIKRGKKIAKERKGSA
ncbi:MAG: hypothetical protein M0Z55_00115 [Peptococcaceae bacterium]|nr:hypothetical protein [Peptococcaceae bacterium]